MKPLYATVLLLTQTMLLMGCTGTTTIANSERNISAHVVAVSLVEQSARISMGVTSKTTEEANMNQITIEVGGKIFSATLADHDASRTFAGCLPMTVQMSDLNGQEKFYALPDDLPADSTERPSSIRNGDIFCWSGNTLVLFYNTFTNSYGGYVRLGAVDDPAGLAAALGSGNIEVTWSFA